MKKKLLFTAIIFSMTLFCFAQETITAQSETLTTVAFGKDSAGLIFQHFLKREICFT
ncbi:hypothetical protein [Treponema bryantii]|uniref:hypothetical protein n=1 Tax=Treponema bryantii TaxID=163 RepID=UPI0015A72031|nr:hypothetical protein [Treponema bryantii]